MMESKRILIVDDEQDLLNFFSLILKKEGYIFDSFTNASEALSKYKTNYYDLVLLDIKMPDIDGFDLYKKIKDVDQTIEIYFLTASEFYYENFRKEEYKNLSSELFIYKPIGKEELVNRIEHILRQDNRRKDNQF